MRIDESESMYEEAKTLASSGCSASATARPPIPRPASNGLMAMPSVSRTMRAPAAKTRIETPRRMSGNEPGCSFPLANPGRAACHSTRSTSTRRIAKLTITTLSASPARVIQSRSFSR